MRYEPTKKKSELSQKSLNPHKHNSTFLFSSFEANDKSKHNIKEHNWTTYITLHL